MEKKTTKDKAPTAVFKVGAIALAFLIIGYQSALFVHRAAALHIAAARDKPDTVFVVDEALAARLLAPVDSGGHGREPGGAVTLRREAPHSAAVQQERHRTRRVESFRFNPNTVSVADLVRLGFSEKQAEAIESYRARGGRFRRPADFAKSYVVADSVFRRLEPYISIPKLDINKADSAAFDGLPGIGPFYAAKMVEYRERLGGYSFKEQLMDIYRFERERYDGLADLIVCSEPEKPFRLWSLPEDSLRLHPYIKTRQAAHSIVLFRDNTPREGWTAEALGAAGIIPAEDAAKLARCRLE